jgi:FkbM family methyltransferase
VKALELTRRIGYALHVRRPVRAAMRAWSKLHPHCICVRQGIRYRLDLSQTIERSLYFYGSWEADTTAFLLRTVVPGDTVIEVGSNIGAHTLVMAKASRPGTVYAFEPSTFARERLTANLRLNPTLTNIEVIPKLVTNEKQEVPLRDITWSFKYDGSCSPPETVTAPVTHIDEFCSARGIGALKLLKVDVDGYDFKVLQGATRTIERLRPIVLMELCDPALRRCGDSVDNITSLLSSLGYSRLLHCGKPIGEADSNAVFAPDPSPRSILHPRCHQD